MHFEIGLAPTVLAGAEVLMADDCPVILLDRAVERGQEPGLQEALSAASGLEELAREAVVVRFLEALVKLIDYLAADASLIDFLATVDGTTALIAREARSALGLGDLPPA